jgi:hypothetical protein
MIISEDTQRVVELLEEYAKNSLRKKNDFSLIMELGATHSLPDQILDLIFIGKVIWTLSATIKKAQPNSEGIELVQKEFEQNLDKIKTILTYLSQIAEQEDKERLEVTYLQMTRGCVLNIIDLSHDLAKFKNMQIESKG